MNAIAVVGSNWEIGRGLFCSFNLKQDRERFRGLTMGHTVIMGKTTLLSLPDAKPLPGRTNIVLTRKLCSIPDATVCLSIQEALAVAPEDSWVIGGESIFHGFLPHCSRVCLTKVNASYPMANRFFPNLDTDPAWCEGTVSEEMHEWDLTYRFVDYIRVPRLHAGSGGG